MRHVKPHPTFEGAVGFTTDFDEEFQDYTVSLLGSFRGYHFSNVKPKKIELVRALEDWQALFKKDEKLYDDVQGWEFGDQCLKTTADKEQVAKKQDEPYQ